MPNKNPQVFRIDRRARRGWWAALATVAAATAGVASSTQAQCQFSWLEGQSTPTSSINGSVNTSTLWDPDGAGPKSPSLVFGGYFSNAGGTPAACIAAWDGATRTWSAFGSGPNGRVDRIAVYNGQVIVAGEFARGNDVDRLKRWDGSTWQAWVQVAPPGHVDDMLVFGGELVIGGAFATVDGVFTRSVAAWNGTNWRTIGFPAMFVTALGVVNNELYAVLSSPSRSAVRWNPTAGTWDTIGTFSFTPVPSGGTYLQSIVEYNGELIVGGAFDHVDGVAVNHIAAWNPATATWHALGSGLTSSSTISRVQSMIVVGDDLIVGGDFVAAGGQPAHDIAKWNGADAQWTALGTGTTGTTSSPNAYVATLAEYRGELVAGGHFENAGGIPSKNWARWGPPSLEALAPRVVCHGGTPMASIRATGVSAGGFLFEWRRNSVSIDPVADPRFVITTSADGQTSTLTVVPPGLSEVGPGVLYDCIVTWDCGSLASQTAFFSTCPGDFDCSGQVAVQDIFAFLDAYFRQDPMANYDGNPAVTVQDVFDFLAAYFTGC